MLNKRDFSIEIIRVVAMLMIIFDHILSRLTFPLQSMIVQLANSGVFLFLFLSGYLYGNRNIQDWKQWFIKRLFRICVPLWVFIVIDFIVEYSMWNQFDIKYIFIYAFNLQGILGVNIGGTNLWFLTLIMICYLITPFLQWIRQRQRQKKWGLAYLVFAILIQIILAYQTDIGMIAGHTISWCILAIGMYVTGYLAGNILLNTEIEKNKIIRWTIWTIIAMALVVICNFKFDGLIIYDRIVIYYGLIIIDLWIGIIFYKIGMQIREKYIQDIIKHLDMISYEFYIVHGLIIAILANNVITRFGSWVYILCILFLSYIASIALHYICESIYKVVYRKIKII